MCLMLRGLKIPKETKEKNKIVIPVPVILMRTWVSLLGVSVTEIVSMRFSNAGRTQGKEFGACHYGVGRIRKRRFCFKQVVSYWPVVMIAQYCGLYS